MNAKQIADKLDTYSISEYKDFKQAVNMLRDLSDLEDFFKQHDPMGYQAFLARNVGETK